MAYLDFVSLFCQYDPSTIYDGCYVKCTQRSLLLDRLHLGDAHKKTNIWQAIVQKG